MRPNEFAALLPLSVTAASSSWHVRVSTISDFTIGACCAALMAALAYLVRRVSWLKQREREGQRREAELTSMVEQLSLAYSRAQELAELKTQIFTNVSHELRTPLTLILGPIQQLREAGDASREQLEALAVIERNASLLLGHVTDLLALSRADAVGVVQDLRPTDVVLMLRALGTSFRPLAKDSPAYLTRCTFLRPARRCSWTRRSSNALP